MIDEEYKEPTNAQLARFLTVYATQIPELGDMRFSAKNLELLMSKNPRFREAALRHHRRFQEALIEHSQKMQAGELQCDHKLKSGKQCPNRNEPGCAWCGLHREQYEVENAEYLLPDPEGD